MPPVLCTARCTFFVVTSCMLIYCLLWMHNAVYFPINVEMNGFSSSCTMLCTCCRQLNIPKYIPVLGSCYNIWIATVHIRLQVCKFAGIVCHCNTRLFHGCPFEHCSCRLVVAGIHCGCTAKQYKGSNSTMTEQSTGTLVNRCTGRVDTGSLVAAA